MQAPAAIARHILIDFENVPHTSLAPVAGYEIELTLLLGEKNKKLEVALVEELLAAGSRAHVIRVGATGRNALDLTLAYYLGRAAATSPRTEFYIVSKDADYDAMIRHARSAGLHVERADSVEALSFLPRQPTPREPIPRQPSPRQSTSRSSAPRSATPAPARAPKTAAAPAPVPAPAPMAMDDDLDAIIENLRKHPTNRPTRERRLASHIRSILGGEVSDDAVAALVAGLKHAGLVAISEKGAVSYKLAAS